MAVKNYPSGTIHYRSDIDVYGVLVNVKDAKKYVKRKKVSEEIFKKFVRKGVNCSLIYFPSLEIKQKRDIPFSFTSPEFPGYSTLTKDSLRQRRKGLGLDQLVILDKIEEFLRFLELN